MATESIEVSGVVHAPAERIYEAWLSSTEHTAMTGSRAEVEGNVGGRFSAYDGRIEGAMLELEPGRRIVQRWRSTDFPSEEGDSLLEVRLEPVDNGTRVIFVHSEIPEGQATQLEEGWRKYYLEPMGRYFASTLGSGEMAFEGESVELPGAEEAEEAKPKPPKKAAPKKKAAAAPKAKAKPAAKKAAPRRAKKAKAARRGARSGGAKKAKSKGKSKAKRSSRRGKR